MHRYSFMRQKVMEKIDIPTYVKRRYGIEINSKSLSEDMIYKQAQQELDKALNRKYIDELYKIGGNECEKTKEIQYLSCLISNIIERISKVDFLFWIYGQIVSWVCYIQMRIVKLRWMIK
jgi:hypothetical protein